MRLPNSLQEPWPLRRHEAKKINNKTYGRQQRSEYERFTEVLLRSLWTQGQYYRPAMLHPN